MPQTQSMRRAATREKLLQAAFTEVNRHGFQAASLNVIVAAAGITKGALFHHFTGKQELGYALVDEVIGPLLHGRWIAPLADAADPVTALQGAFRHYIAQDIADGYAALGCPLNNLAQEMSPLDEGMRARVDGLYTTWRDTVAVALERGQRAGTVRGDADVRGAAILVVLAQQGIWGTGKYSQDPELMTQAGEALCASLERLRADAGTSPGSPQSHRESER